MTTIVLEYDIVLNLVLHTRSTAQSIDMRHGFYSFSYFIHWVGGALVPRSVEALKRERPEIPCFWCGILVSNTVATHGV